MESLKKHNSSQIENKFFQNKLNLSKTWIKEISLTVK